jgi:hypothetical protein
MKLSFLGMSLISLTVAGVTGIGAHLIQRSVDITCARAGAVSNATCQFAEPLLKAIWILPGVFLFAAVAFMVANLMVSQVLGVGNDDLFGE